MENVNAIGAKTAATRSEILVAGTKLEEVYGKKDQKLLEVFTYADKDGDGVISEEEADFINKTEVYTDEFKKKTVVTPGMRVDKNNQNEVLKELDANSDGVVSEDEIELYKNLLNIRNNALIKSDRKGPLLTIGAGTLIIVGGALFCATPVGWVACGAAGLATAVSGILWGGKKIDKSLETAEQEAQKTFADYKKDNMRIALPSFGVTVQPLADTVTSEAKIKEESDKAATKAAVQTAVAAIIADAAFRTTSK